MYRRARGHARQESQLVEPEAQRKEHLKVEVRNRPARVSLEQEIEQALPTQHTQGQLGRQGRICALSRGVGFTQARV